jgi:imidazolonepropionase
MNDLIIHNIGKLYSPDKNRFGALELSEKCSVVVKNGLIDEIVPADIEINASKLEKFEVLDAKGLTVVPGFVDSHAHPVFAALRNKEFEMRNAGMTYMEIANAGGGIKNSVKKLRAMTEDELFHISASRVKEFLRFGTTTLEAKSGYGLTFEDEMKMLKVIRRLNDRFEIDLVPTFLGAHDVPDEYKDDREAYIAILIDKMIPEIAAEKLAVACDIFIEKNYYTVEEGRRILTAAKRNGLGVKIHADQMSCSGASGLAAELGALSADHLEYISDTDIDRMVEAGVIFNLMPGSSFFLGMRDFPPARKIIERGGVCALSTDFNPGTCYCYSLPFIMTVSAIYLKMTAEELLWSATIGGAKALGLENSTGSIEKGKKADMLLMKCSEINEIPYSMGMNLVKNVVKNGKVVI